MSISIARQCAAAIRTAEEDDWHLSYQHESSVVSQGDCDGDRVERRHARQAARAHER
ncbi:hypothetical protein [Collinsella intestinalis]